MAVGQHAGEVLARGIARLRVERDLTQEAFAERVGVSAPFIAKLEQGKKAPSVATINDICTVLRVRPSELFAAGEPSVPELTKPEADLLRSFRDVPPDRRKDVLSIVRAVVRAFSEQSRPVRERKRLGPKAASRATAKTR